MKCFWCKGEIEPFVIPEYEGCWGEKKVTVKNVDCNKCVECGEIVFTAKQARELQIRVGWEMSAK